MTVKIIEPGNDLVLILACPGIDLDLLKLSDSDLGDRSDSCFCWCY